MKAFGRQHSQGENLVRQLTHLVLSLKYKEMPVAFFTSVLRPWSFFLVPNSFGSIFGANFVVEKWDF